MLVPSMLAVRPTFDACSICNCAVELENAKTDESGKAVHEECYVQKVGVHTAGRQPAPIQRDPDGDKNPVRQAVIEFLNCQAARPVNRFCPVCGSPLESRDTTFFYDDRTWNIHLTTCVRCDPVPKDSVV